MYTLALVLGLLSFASGCQGLEFTMEHDVVVTRGGRATCAIVQCVEQGHTVGYNATSSPDQDQPDSPLNPAVVNTLTELAISKAPSGDTPGAERGDRLLMAHLTAEKPWVSSVSDGVKVDGHLDARRATITMELVNQEDCQAEFTCHVRAMDSQGRELVRSARLVQQPRVERSEVRGRATGGGSWTPALVIHLVDLVRQLHTDLALKVDSWEDKLDAKMATLETKVKDSLHDDLQAFHNRFEDRINSLQNRLEGKIETAREKADSSNLGSPASSDTSFIKSQLQQIENQTQGLLQNLVNAFSHPEGSLDQDPQELSLSMNSSAVEIRSYLGNALSGLGGVTQSEIQSLMTDLLTPKTCRRGVVSALAQATCPYSVIQPGDGDILDSPYLCDTLTDGGGWIIFQRRSDGDVDFYRDWAEYRKGFGSPDTDFWLGNDRIHALTSQAEFELRVDLKYRGTSAYAQYSTFAIADEKNNYALSLGPYIGGTAGDSMGWHNGMNFTTFDRDNDFNNRNCAFSYTGAWWYCNCALSNLNGKWGAGSDKGPQWHHFTDGEPAYYTEMKIRRIGN